jgi:hypothetical protein
MGKLSGRDVKERVLYNDVIWPKEIIIFPFLMAKFQTLDYGIDSKPTFREFDSLLGYNFWARKGEAATSSGVYEVLEIRILAD